MMHSKPSITSVIGQRVQLRRAGCEFKALCPFHSEKTPSFTVNEAKSVFYCHGCHVGGDVFDFIMKLDDVTFPEACAQLGIASTWPTPKRADPVKSTAAVITEWANELTEMINEELREIGQRARIARMVGWRDEVDLLGREWMVLETLADDLQDQVLVIDLWREREIIDGLNSYNSLNPCSAVEEFPELTAEYWAMVGSYVVAEVDRG